MANGASNMTEEVTSVLIADDHPIYRRGLRQIVDDLPGFTVVAEASDGAAALAAMAARPRVVILDIAMPPPDGLTVLDTLTRQPEPPIAIMLTLFDDAPTIQRALELGARGYLLKDDAESELPRCLATVLAGRRYLSDGIVPRGARMELAVPTEPLTPAEQRILVLVADYLTSREIAERLHLSLRTVQNHRANMAAKLGLTGSNALLRYAVAACSTGQTQSATAIPPAPDP